MLVFADINSVRKKLGNTHESEKIIAKLFAIQRHILDNDRHLFVIILASSLYQ